MRLGFSVRVFGRSGLRSHDARRPLQQPHLSISLVCLRDILGYLRDKKVHMYRMHSGLTPALTEEGSAGLEEIDQCTRELAALGETVRACDVRLSFHPYSTVVLNALNEDRAATSVAQLETQAAMMDAMCLGPEAVIVVHVGGVYDDLRTSRQRFVRRYEALPEVVRRRLALEHDDHRFSHADVRAIHEQCGVKLVFDNLHHLVLNPRGISTREALAYSLNTWPEGVVPKIHFSTPRTEMRPWRRSAHVKVPTWTEHSEYVNPFEFIAFMRMASGLRPFDVMLESKARDLALFRLWEDLRRFAPDLAS